MTSTTTPETGRARNEEVRVREVLDGIVRAWAGKDADAFADAYTKNARMILSDNRFLRGREVIRDAVTEQFATAQRGTTLVQDVVDLRFLQPGVALVITEGGDLSPDDAESAAGSVRATWVLANGLDGWRIAAYQNTPIPDETRPGG
ncbi:SgcJ/EcaC family oxidoreductase [Saccharothrix luteola]|uniref:SgcJ/EcaC family oxidoreductase n=1 Tax=Saccharothrix luteola TaxID=2893018 RepID=UPI001E2F1BEA|nr:SgcJ/EcaC family oxidoreductase [Saccharothrix luteola]MCC8251658.1 SgcJ/EcaC family oxidoreductase [Saccharothrix luteola]